MFDRAKNTTTRQDSLQPEHHLARVLKQNKYPNIFIQSSSKPTRMDVEATRAPALEEWHRLTLVMHPYTEGVSENVRQVCREFGMKVVFRSAHSLCSMLTKVKDTLMMEKQASCGKAYTGETLISLETRVKEHRDACQKGALEMSALAEHTWKNHHPITWARPTKELLLKMVIHIHLNHPPINRDGDLESCLDAE